MVGAHEPSDPLETARLWVGQAGRIAEHYAAKDREQPGLGAGQ